MQLPHLQDVLACPTEAVVVCVARSYLMRKQRMKLPIRSQTAALAGVNFMLHTAGWLEGGLGYGL